jgi:hypothetical protein
MKKYLSLVSTLCVSLLVLLSTASSKPHRPMKALKVVDANVTVFPGSGSGSGPIFINGDADFVWTAGHVVSQCEQVKTVIDPATGLSKVQVKYNPVTVMQEEIEDGKKVAEHTYLADIIRYSPPEAGEDLALLRVKKKMAFTKGIRFDTSVPEVGTPIFHVGSMHGRNGAQSYSEGVFSRAGRLLYKDKTYDQVSLTAMPGSSGGGVFYKKSGLCLGLVTEGLTARTESAILIVPARVIAEYAKRTHCEYAVDPNVKVPEKDDTPVRDIPLPERKEPEAARVEKLPISLPEILDRVIAPIR